MRLQTLFLKLAVFILGIPVLGVFIFFVPEFADFAAKLYPDIAFIKYLFFIDFYLMAIPYYFALYQAFILLCYIERNMAFSEWSIRALELIKYCAIAICGLFVLGLPLFYLVAERDDAPGFILIGMFFAFASMVVAVFANVLQRLTQNVVVASGQNS